jgi:hypothetical protein
MIINLSPNHRSFHERRDDEHGSELQGGVSDFLPEVGQVVFVSSSDFFNQAMHSETLKHSGDLGSGLFGQDGAKETILESPDVKFSVDDTFEQLQILAVKEIKPTIAPLAIPALGDDLLDPFFLTEILLPDKFDLQTIFLGQALSPETNFVPQGFGKLGVIENTNTLGSQMTTHRIGITDVGKGPGNDDPIEARKDPSNLTGISFCQDTHGSNLLRDAQKDSLYL